MTRRWPMDNSVLAATVYAMLLGCAEDTVEGRVLGLVVVPSDTRVAEATWIVLPREFARPLYLRHIEGEGVVPRVNWGLGEPDGVVERVRRLDLVSVEMADDVESLSFGVGETSGVGVIVRFGDDELKMGSGVWTARSWRARDWENGGDVSVLAPRCSALRVVASVVYGGDVASRWIRHFPLSRKRWEVDSFRVAVQQEVQVEGMHADTANMDCKTIRDGVVVPGALRVIIGFGFDSSIVADSATSTLAEIARRMEGNPRLRVSIEGHADTVGTVHYNCRLAMDRAKSVFKVLRKYGVRSARLDTVSFGEHAPRGVGTDTRALGEDRRVELVVTEAAGSSAVVGLRRELEQPSTRLRCGAPNTAGVE